MKIYSQAEKIPRSETKRPRVQHSTAPKGRAPKEAVRSFYHDQSRRARTTTPHHYIFFCLFAAADLQQERKFLLSHSFITDAVKLKKRKAMSLKYAHHEMPWIIRFFLHSFIHFVNVCVNVYSYFFVPLDQAILIEEIVLVKKSSIMGK